MNVYRNPPPDLSRQGEPAGTSFLSPLDAQVEAIWKGLRLAVGAAVPEAPPAMIDAVIDAMRQAHGDAVAGKVRVRMEAREGIAAVEEFTGEPPLVVPEPVAETMSGVAEDRVRARFIKNMRAIEVAACQTCAPLSIEDRRSVLEYSGWGGLGRRLFDESLQLLPDVAAKWPPGFPVPEPHGLLRDFYTPLSVTREVARVVNEAQSAGMIPSGPKVLEPSVGSGRFLLPYMQEFGERYALSGTPTFVACEFQETTAKLVSAAFPQVTVLQGPFEAAVNEYQEQWQGHFNLVLANPPYGDRGAEVVLDSDRNFRDGKAWVYFLRRTLRFLAPGGIGVYLIPYGCVSGATSHLARLRREIVTVGHVLDAWRMPSRLFPQANIVTDLLFVQRRPAELAEVLAEDEFFVNGEFFLKHPEKILGTERNRPGDGDSESEEGKRPWRYQVDGVFERLPSGVEGWRTGVVPEGTAYVQEKSRAPRAKGRVGVSTSVTPEEVLKKVDAVHWDRVNLALRLGGRVQRLLAQKAAGDSSANSGIPEIEADLQAFLARYGAPGGEDDLIRNLRSGSSELAAFLSAFDNGNVSASILSLVVPPRDEALSLTDLVNAHEVLARRVAGSITVGTWLTALRDAGLSADEATVLRMTADSGLFFGLPSDTPLSNESVTVENSDVYLTGRLWSKVDAATASLTDKMFGEFAQRQVAKLYEVIRPLEWNAIPNLTPFDAWIPIEIISAFVKSMPWGKRIEGLTRTPERIVTVVGVPYEILPDREQLDLVRVFLGWLNADRKYGNLSNDILNQLGGVFKGFQISDRHDDPAVVEQKRARARETYLANITLGFHEWLNTSPDEVKNGLADVYNRMFRGVVARTYQPARLPHIARWNHAKYTLSSVQKAGVQRLIDNKGGLIAYDVGVGKTFTACASIALAKQMGLAKRPIVVIPKTIAMKWQNDFQQKVLPDYRVALIGVTRTVLSKKDALGNPVVRSRADTAEERGEKWKDFQAGLYDVALVTYEALSRTQLRKETIAAYIAESTQLDRQVARSERNDLRKAETKDAPASEATVRTSGQRGAQATEASIRSKKEELVAKSLELREGWDYDTGVFWEDLGVDWLVLDEAHNFKNLWTISSSNIGGIPKYAGATQSAVRSWHLDIRCKSVRDRRSDGRGITLLTATPAKNSPLELYTMLSYIDPKIWARQGFFDMDAFYRRYIRTDAKATANAQGGVSIRSVVSGFQALDELRDTLLTYAEFKYPEDAGLVLPEPNIVNVTVEPSVSQLATMNEWRGKAKEAMSDPAKRGMALAFLGRFRAAALHPWIAVRTLPGVEEADDEESGQRSKKKSKVFSESAKEIQEPAFTDNFELETPKITECLNYIKSTMAPDCGHIIFCESVPVHAILVAGLISRGVPREKIGIFNNELAHTAEQRLRVAELFNGDAEAGIAPTYDVIIANQIAYEGVDLQYRTCAIHHLDLPWNPAMLQQRNGRAVRQGNTLAQITIRYYLTANGGDIVKLGSILGKKAWLQEVVAGSVRATNNPACDENVSEADMMVELADSPEEARAAFAKAEADLQEKIVQGAKRDALVLARSAHDKFRQAERNTEPAMQDYLRKEAERLLAQLRSIGSAVWPYPEVTEALRTKQCAFPDDNKTNVAPLISGGWIERFSKLWRVSLSSEILVRSNEISSGNPPVLKFVKWAEYRSGEWTFTPRYDYVGADWTTEQFNTLGRYILTERLTQGGPFLVPAERDAYWEARVQKDAGFDYSSGIYIVDGRLKVGRTAIRDAFPITEEGWRRFLDAFRDDVMATVTEWRQLATPYFGRHLPMGAKEHGADIYLPLDERRRRAQERTAAKQAEREAAKAAKKAAEEAEQPGLYDNPARPLSSWSDERARRYWVTLHAHYPTFGQKVAALRPHMASPEGFVADLEKRVTGRWPGERARMVRA